MEKRSDVALLLMRIGFGIFFLIFGLLKFVAQGPMLGNVYPQFWGGLAITVLVVVIGILQIVGGVLLMLGLFHMPTSILLGVMHLGTVIVSLQQILTPFSFPQGGPPHFLFFGGVPILFSLVALILLGPGSMSLDARKKGQ